MRTGCCTSTGPAPFVPTPKLRLLPYRIIFPARSLRRTTFHAQTVISLDRSSQKEPLCSLSDGILALRLALVAQESQKGL